MGILELKIQSQLMCKITMNKNMPKIKLFLLFMYCLIYGKILKYMSFTIFIQSSLHNKPFRNKMIQGLLFRWAICGPCFFMKYRQLKKNWVQKFICLPTYSLLLMAYISLIIILKDIFDEVIYINQNCFIRFSYTPNFIIPALFEK